MRIAVDVCDACPVPDGMPLLLAEGGGFLLYDLEPFKVEDDYGARKEVWLCSTHAEQLRRLAGLMPGQPPG